MNKISKIPLMRPFMPPREEFDLYLDRIWESRQLTNQGEIHREFEEALGKYLGVEHICLLANGTLALLFALKFLDLKGEVITTPFTSVATLQAVYWNRLKPVFVDINADDLNISPEKIDAAVSHNTCAILPVHVFGNPCQVDAIREIAARRNLKTVYDAAHCFGAKLDGISLCAFGDLSILSFHATKVFNSFEGGAIICHNKATKDRIDAMKNLTVLKGLDNLCHGFNAKMNEIQAAFGLLQLRYIDDLIKKRQVAFHLYHSLLSGIRGIHFPHGMSNASGNYTYLPIIVHANEFGLTRDELANMLENHGITTRKYFYPLVSEFPLFSEFKTFPLPVAEKIAGQILCLPLYHDLTIEEITFITDSIKHMACQNQN